MANKKVGTLVLLVLVLSLTMPRKARSTEEVRTLRSPDVLRNANNPTKDLHSNRAEARTPVNPVRLEPQETDERPFFFAPPRKNQSPLLRLFEENQGNSISGQSRQFRRKTSTEQRPPVFAAKTLHRKEFNQVRRNQSFHQVQDVGGKHDQPPPPAAKRDHPTAEHQDHGTVDDIAELIKVMKM